MHRSHRVRSFRQIGQPVIALALATFAGCVSRQCPEGQKFEHSACADEAAADAATDAEVAPIADVPSTTGAAPADAGSRPGPQDAGAHARADAAVTPVTPVMPVVPVVPIDAGRSDAQAPSIDSGPACAFTGRETCNGKDDDCDGTLDEDADDLCSSPHAIALCASGKCRRRGCEVGFADCNDMDADGCEQAKNAPDNCGECGVTCDARATCATTKVEGVGHCTCDAPTFGDGSTCQGPAPIAAGVRWTCGIDPDHHAICYGQQNATLITKLPATTKYKQLVIANALGIGCGVTLDDRLDCWNGPFSGAPGRFVQVVAGETFVCGLTRDLDPMCWSYGTGAQFGETEPPDEKLVQLAAGPYHVCGLRAADGKAVCWGAGSLKRTTNCPLDPDNVDCGQGQPPDEAFVQITAGRVHTCGLMANGQVKCWGIGGPDAKPFSKETYYAQTVVPEDEMTFISAGAWHTCGLRKSDHNAVCWGAGIPGYLSEYDKGQSTPPSGEFRSLAAGYLHTCGVTPKGGIQCWGDNTYGQAPAATQDIF